MTKDQKDNLIAYFAIALSDAYTYGRCCNNPDSNLDGAEQASHRSSVVFMDYLHAIKLTESSTHEIP